MPGLPSQSLASAGAAFFSAITGHFLASSAFTDVMGTPAWKSVPSWYLVAKDDQALPPEAEMQFAQRMGATTVEVPSSHLAMVSHPDAVIGLIEQAADACQPTDG